MEHAKRYHIGHHPTARKAKTAKTASTGQRICKLDAAEQRCIRNSQGQEKVGTHTHAANGFLKTRFLPKLEKRITTQDAMEQQEMEDDFYRSLYRIANYYDGFMPTDTRSVGYPYNMALSVWETQDYLKRNVKDRVSLNLVQDDNGKTFFITEHRYSTGTNLYYIPVIPLYKMLRLHERRKAGLLLVSVCAYLYHIADIPYYRQENSYLYWEYEMIKEWIEQDEEMEEDNRLQELAVAESIGDYMERKIYNRKNIEFLSCRIDSFSACTDYEWQCLRLAEQALSLYTDYPDTTIFRHGQYRCPDMEIDEEVIRMDKYISFVADTKGWLYENLADCINNEFNECSEMEEPLIRKRFDGISSVEDDLAFEDRVFNLINDLCYLLNND